jgi:hypothetical protein
VRVLSDVETGVVVRRLDPIDIGNVHERDLSGALDNEGLGGSWATFPMMSQPLLGALERTLKPRIGEGLQQVIEGASLECAQRVVVMRGYEDDDRRLIATQQLENIESIALRHLYVEEYKVRPRGPNLSDRLRT